LQVSRSRSEGTNFSFVPLSCHDSLNRSLGEPVYDHCSGGPASVGGGAAPEEDSEEEDSSDQEEEQDGGGAPPEQFDGDPELPGLGEDCSGVFSPAGWGDVPEEDDEEGGTSDQDDEQDMYGAPPVPPEDDYFPSDGDQDQDDDDDFIGGEAYAEAANSFNIEMQRAAVPERPEIYVPPPSHYVKR
jgi:hypothetical protein